MEQVISLLAKIATELDNQGRTKLSERVDKISRSVLDIKTAQYVGMQGYWIRNGRCWHNCYRQKRAEDPKKPAQVVWSECHEEYLDSVNDSEASWNKYADSSGSDSISKNSKKKKKSMEDGEVSVVKKKDMHLPSVIITSVNAFQNNIDKNLRQGMSMGHAINSSIEEQHKYPRKQLIWNARYLTAMADELYSVDRELSDCIGMAASYLMREAKEALSRPF